MTEKSTESPKPFSEKMTDILNYSALNLAMAIGYRTGLFDVMDTFNTPRTLNRPFKMRWSGVILIMSQ